MKKYFLFLAVMMLASCKEGRPENNVYFEEAQPANTSELVKIPSRFLGTYSHNDSVALGISPTSIAYHYIYKVKLHKSGLDSLKNEVAYENGNYIEKTTNTVLESRVFGDSIEFKIRDVDTIFKLSVTDKAKKSNGKLILSKQDSIYWRIKILTLEKNNLSVKEFDADKDIKSIDSLCKIKSEAIDRGNYVAKPSRKEFTKILKLKKLGTNTIYQKVKP
jgi:hypothetical protein